MRIKLAGLDKALRLDQFLRMQFPDWGRKEIGKAISRRRVRINGKVIWLASWLVHNGDVIETDVPSSARVQPWLRFDPSWIIQEFDDLVAVNKPAGLLSAPSRSTGTVNLHDLARAYFGELLLFHRLDRDTSGVVLLTRPGKINRLLDKAFKTRAVTKEYRAAVVWPNTLPAKGMIEAPLAVDPQRRDQMIVSADGMTARTRYEVLAEEPARRRQQVRLWPETGRTHQLRVHMAHLGVPILGDRLYGSIITASRLMLHALRLELPALHDQPPRLLEAPLPQEFI
ncbi:MAG TPA: RluA family pseudouridine synthase [Gemmatales bacterium]|nr:RluA family pseudouridine synthase [Gemmatales bacterium]HMP15460.1 RluA family pseudouridine synthase [Gemmatales bacterium]